jgi:hypothetical protein
MNIIDIIAIIPYFITLATVVAEEEDTLQLPKAPVSPQVASTNNSRKTFQCSKISFSPKRKLFVYAQIFFWFFFFSSALLVFRTSQRIRLCP